MLRTQRPCIAALVLFLVGSTISVSTAAVTGRVVLDPGATANLKDAEIQIGAIDGKGQQSVKCDADGSFKFETSAAGILAIARTTDGRAYGTLVTQKLQEPIEIKLAPTQDFEGQLLDKDGQPFAGEEIRATIKVNIPHFGGSPKPFTFEFEQFKAKTDAQGKFKLRGLPTKREIALYCYSSDHKSTVCLDRFEFKADQLLPPKVLRENVPKPPKETSLSDRFASALRDCSAKRRRLMLILAHDSEPVQAFIDGNLLDAKKNTDVDAFVSIVVPFNWNLIKPSDILFFKDHNLALPMPGSVDVSVFDAEGKSLGHQNISILRRDPAEKAAELLRRYARAAQPEEKTKN
jgi:hypothetical protein